MMVARETISDGKYVVFKVDDFYQFVINLWNTHWSKDGDQTTVEEAAKPYVVMDGVVIRRQDVFAAPALYAYSNAILVAIEVMKSLDLQYGEMDEVIDHLMAKSDYFAMQAELSADTPRKVPD
jgi:hypothetical protein